MRVGWLSESDAVDALRLPFYSSRHARGSHVPGNQFDLGNTRLEVCTCNILCPCWVGEDPDNGDCQSIMAWHFDSGTIDGVDVSGLTFAGVMDIPGNVLLSLEAVELEYLATR